MEFKVGDIVEGTDRTDNSYGLVGTVVARKGAHKYLVNYGPDFTGHSGGSIRQLNYNNWWETSETIKLAKSHYHLKFKELYARGRKKS